MFNANPFHQPGQWYRGNTHSHSTESDGQLPMSDRFAAYREAEYDFLVLTDHRKVNDVSAYSTSDFLAISGSEVHPSNPYGGATYHFVAINIHEAVNCAKMHPNAVIDEIKAQGGEAVLCHPYWCGHTITDYLPLRGYFAIEVYNDTCMGIGKGFSEQAWDDLLDRGGPVLGIASDDAHGTEHDCFHGWIMVKAQELTLEGIMEALRTGAFYSTLGPEIVDMTLEGKELTVKCSPAQSIVFKSECSRGRRILPPEGELLTEGTYSMPGSAKYVRVEVTDETGEEGLVEPRYFSKTIRLGVFTGAVMQNILVCQTGGWIGDMVLLTPALRALKQASPESRLELLLRPRVADLMESHPYVDACIVDEKTEGRCRSLTRLVRQIRDKSFDLAVVLHPTSFRNALLPFLARVPTRIGTNVSGRGMLLTKSCRDDTNVHEIHRYLRVLQLLGIDTTSDGLEFWHTDTDRCFIENLLRAEGVSRDDRLIAVNLGTTWTTKRWDVINFAEVIQQITRLNREAKVVLTGSPTEQTLTEVLPASLPIINLVGKTSILQLGALLERCEVCLTCDSGPMHIAAAVGTPTVALFGPTDPTRHRPYGIGHTVIEKPVSCRPCYKRACHRQDAPHLCMQEIGTGEVVKAVETRLYHKDCVV